MPFLRSKFLSSNTPLSLITSKRSKNGHYENLGFKNWTFRSFCLNAILLRFYFTKISTQIQWRNSVNFQKCQTLPLSSFLTISYLIRKCHILTYKNGWFENRSYNCLLIKVHLQAQFTVGFVLFQNFWFCRDSSPLKVFKMYFVFV